MSKIYLYQIVRNLKKRFISFITKILLINNLKKSGSARIWIGAKWLLYIHVVTCEFWSHPRYLATPRSQLGKWNGATGGLWSHDLVVTNDALYRAKLRWLWIRSILESIYQFVSILDSFINMIPNLTFFYCILKNLDCCFVHSHN